MERFYSRDLQCEVQQIQVRTARNLFNDGCTIYLQSSNMAFDNFWQKPIDINRSRLGYKETFETICNNFRYYNCSNEQGNYIHYYVKVTDLQNWWIMATYYRNELLEAFNADMATNLPPQARAEYERALRRERKQESKTKQPTLF